MIYIDIQIKPFLKVKKYVVIISFQSLAPVKYQVLYSIMIIKFFTKAIAIIVCFERFQAERGSSKQSFIFLPLTQN